MKQLTGMDANFLYMESPAVFTHVASLSIYDRPHADYQPFEAWREQLAARLHLLPPLTRKLRNVPFNLDHPYWVTDPNFDLDFHVRHTAVPAPGGKEQVSALVGRIAARSLDRSRPLWESYVIEGLADDQFAVLTKVHHAAADGAAGAELLTLMLDSTPEGDVIPPATFDPDADETIPTDAEMLALAGRNLVRKPARLAVLAARTVRAFGDVTDSPIIAGAAQQFRDQLRGPVGAVLNAGRSRPEEADALPKPLPLSVPRTSFNYNLTPHRIVAYESFSLDAMKAVKTAAACTLNDVVIAMCAGGLRTYLSDRGELPDDPLHAIVPVSIRTGAEEDPWTNRVSTTIATLPTNEPDARERIRKSHEAMLVAKQMHETLPMEEMTGFIDFPPPAVFTRASRLQTRLQMANRTAPFANLAISNIAGPRHELFAAGAKLRHFFPVSVLTEGQGLNITVQSYVDTLDFGLVGCTELIPDIADLMDAIVDDLDGLAADLGVSDPVLTAAARA